MHQQCICSLQQTLRALDWIGLAKARGIIKGRIAWWLPRDHTSEDIRPETESERDRQSPLSEAIPQEFFFPHSHMTRVIASCEAAIYWSELQATQME